jgi:hypothetical protein
MTTPKNRIVTLGEFLGPEAQAYETDSEALKAARVFAPKDVPTGLGSPIGEVSDISGVGAVSEFGKRTTEGNPYNPSKAPEDTPPEEGTRQLSQPHNVFLNDEIDEEAKVQFNTLSKGSDYQPNLGDYFTKNGKIVEQDQKTGHNLLTSVSPGTLSPADAARPGAVLQREYTLPEDELALAAYNLMLSKNMYHPSNKSPYLNYKGKGELAFSDGLYSIQRNLGSFERRAAKVSVAELRKVGYELMMKAQSISADSAKSLADVYAKGGWGSGGFLIDGMILWPHATQIGGGTVRADSLRARLEKSEKVLGHAAQDDFLLVQSFENILGFGADSPHASDTLITADNADSFGTMNSPVEPFSGAFAAGMAMPVILTLGITTFLGTLFIETIISSFKSSTSTVVAPPEHPWTLPLGSRYPRDVGFFKDLIKLYGFDAGDDGSDFFSSMMAGIMSTYGFPEPLTPLTLFGPALLESAVNLVYAPGFYLVITKGILRSLAGVTESFKQLANFQGVFGLIGAVFDIMETIFGSYLFKWMAIMSKVGRIVLRGTLEPAGTAHGSDYIPYDKQKTTPLTQFNRISTTRAFGEDKSVAESSLSLKRHIAGLLLGPVELGIDGLTKFDKDKLSLNPTFGATSGRLDADTVKEIEKQIDNEYVPFSIHDLRTNEIISLPAFIDSVSDDFSVDYSNTQGFGRTDPVYTYSKTTRSINLVFNLVAMNEKDHDYMYYIVNKLVAMCYPQRDMGVLRKTEEGQVFVQPFSQTPTASPVVRIKIGDLIGTNSSAESMRQIFGGDEVLSTKQSDPKKLIETITELSSKRHEQLEGLARDTRKDAEDFKKGTLGAGKTLIIEEQTILAIETDDGKRFATFQTRFPIFASIKGTKKVTTTANKSTLTSPGGSSTEGEIYEIEPENPALIDDLDAAYAFGGTTLLGVVKRLADGGGFLDLFSGPPEAKLYIQKASHNKVTFPAEFEAIDKTRGFEEINTFMSPDSNPVVKAFQNAAGAGLAGVITQMGLQYEGAMWGTNKSKHLRAPMNIKVSISFAPIHDMPLGLTHTGRLFAPSHPVGLLSKDRLEDASNSALGQGAEKSLRVIYDETAAKAKKNLGKNRPDDKSLEDPSKPTLGF